MAERSININRQQQQKIRNAVADYRWKSGTNVQLAEFGAPIIEPSNSPTPSVTPSFTMTPTVTQTPSTTISITPTRTPSNTVTPTVTQTPSSTATPSNTIGASSSATPSFTQTPTKTPSNTATPSFTQTPSNTLTPSNTNTPTTTPSNTVTSTPSISPSVTPSITISPTSTIPVNTFIVTVNGSSAYIINGQSNPTLSITEGETYTFNINASGHPFWIKTVNSTGTGNAYNDGVTNNGTDNGTITFVVPYNAPSTLYYNCQFHSSMAGTINVTDVPTPTATPSPTPTPSVT